MNNSSSAVVVVAVIILASMLVFSGLKTPDSSRFAAFTQDVDNVYTATIDSFAELKVKHAISGDYRTNEQIYIEVVTGNDPGQYAVMGTSKVINGDLKKEIPSEQSTGCQNILENGNQLNYLPYSLPSIREHKDGWYVTSDGRVFNATGFVYNERTYWDASHYTEGELSETYSVSRPEAIAKVILENNGYEVKTK